jgi:hypothetical protein
LHAPGRATWTISYVSLPSRRIWASRIGRNHDVKALFQAAAQRGDYIIGVVS